MTAIRTILKFSWLALVCAAVPASAGTSRIYITNSAGDAINVIDPETNTVVQNIKGIERPTHQFLARRQARLCEQRIRQQRSTCSTRIRELHQEVKLDQPPQQHLALRWRARVHDQPAVFHDELVTTSSWSVTISTAS